MIYFGGVADRLAQIAAAGADGLNMETSMKGYRNDIGEIAAGISDRQPAYAQHAPAAS